MAEAPTPGNVAEAEARGVAVCLANVEGRLHALDNWCPHRRAPLGQGTLEGDAVVCPWHAWAFDTDTGEVLPPERGRVDVYDVRVQADEVWIDLS
jgi:nitrite reductase (NADH) small subunit